MPDAAGGGMVARDEQRWEELRLRANGFDFAATPALMVSADGEVITANRSATALVGREDTGLVGRMLRDHASEDDWALLVAELTACAADPARVGAIRFRFIAVGWPTALVEMLVVASATTYMGRSVMNIQMRDVSRSSAMTTFLRAASDLADGDVLLDALAAGPWGQLPITSLALFSVDRVELALRLRASRGWDTRRTQTYSALPLGPQSIVGLSVLSMEVKWMTMAEMVDRFPLSAPEVRRSALSLDAVVVCLPLISRGVSVGVLWAVLEKQVQQSLQVWETLLSGAQVLALWLRANHLYVAELEGAPTGQHGPGQSATRTSALMLSARDHDVLRLVAQHKTNQEIAGLLGYSEATIRADLTRMGKFLDVSGRRRILQRARDLGLHEG